MVRWKSTSHSLDAVPIRQSARRPIRGAAARRELDDLRIPGLVTSFNMLATMSSAFQLSRTLKIKRGDRAHSREFCPQINTPLGLVLVYFDKETLKSAQFSARRSRKRTVAVR